MKALLKSTKNNLGLPLCERTEAFLNGSCQRVRNTITTPKLKNLTQAYFDIYSDEASVWKRYSLAFSYALKNEPVVLMDNEYLVGQTYHAGHPEDKHLHDLWKDHDVAGMINKRKAAEIPELDILVDKEGKQSWVTFGNCASGHIGWHWDWIVEYGIIGLIDRIHDSMPQVDDIGRESLECMRICLGAILEWNQRHILALEEKLPTVSGKEQEQIIRKIEISRQVPLKGARNFREAVQSFHFSYLATMFENPTGGNGPGRLDYHLWPYLERDLASGAETLDSAREIIDELFIRFHERLLHGADGHVETIVVGGCHPDGTQSINPLSVIMVESIAGLKISHPSVYIRMPEDAPDDFIELAARDLCEGGNRAQIVSDKAIIEAMIRDGHISVEDARNYMCGGCMELSPHGMNGDLLFSGFFNVLKVLEYVLTGGKCLISHKHDLTHLTKNLADFATFDDLYKAFSAELSRSLNLTFRLMDITAEEWAQRRPNFLVSSQVDDCILKGRGINNGGARYEDYGSTPLGLPNVADCLYAIKKAVFEEKFVSGRQLLKALAENFTGHELLHNRLKNIPKYGQGNRQADEMMALVANTICDIYDAYTNRLNGKIKPMIMTFMMAPVAGAAVGASADGRFAGRPVAQGVTPQSAAMKDGITTAMLSQSRIGLDRFSGGASSMWDLDVKSATIGNIKALLKTFINTGGQMYQGNTTDVNELRKAQEHPEQYENMMVRIGGYSGKFVSLSPEIQEEVITRYRHCL